MNTHRPENSTVLLVEDERHLADLYAEYLAEEYTVVTATTGEEAIERLTTDVGVAVVDRRMPMLSGHEVVAAIQEERVDCRVAMVVGSDPAFDVIELGIDDYLVKPVTREELVETVDRLLTVAEYTDAIRELTRLKLTRNVLCVERSRGELEESAEYRDLERRVDSLQSRVDELAATLDIEETPVRM